MAVGNVKVNLLFGIQLLLRELLSMSLFLKQPLANFISVKLYWENGVPRFV
jgi:hypothetical protein